MQVEEYLVKFKNFSYLHCQWLTEAELLKGDKRVSNKVSRFPISSTGSLMQFMYDFFYWGYLTKVLLKNTSLISSNCKKKKLSIFNTLGDKKNL